MSELTLNRVVYAPNCVVVRGEQLHALEMRGRERNTGGQGRDERPRPRRATNSGCINSGYKFRPNDNVIRIHVGVL